MNADTEHASRNGRLVAWIVLAIGTAGGLGYAMWQRGWDLEPWGEEPTIAAHLARGHGFASPADESPAAPPTSWSPPVYPFLAAGVYGMLGIETPAARVALLAINAISLGLAGAAIALLGARLFSRGVGALAGLMVVGHPIFIGHMMFYWDHFLALAMFLCLLVAAHTMGRRPLGTRMYALLGAGMGVLLLTNVSYVLTLPVVAWVATRGLRGFSRLGGLATAAAAALLVLIPWTVRNALVFDRILFVRGGAEAELWLGNVRGSNGLTISVIGRHPFVRPEERRRITGMGETAYFQYCLQRFWMDYRAQPRAFWNRTAKRAVWLVLGDPRDELPNPLIPKWRWRGFSLGHLALAALPAGFALVGIGGTLFGRRRNPHPGPLPGEEGEERQAPHLGPLSRRAGRERVIWPLVVGVLSIVAFIPTHVQDRYALGLRAILYLYAAAGLVAMFARRPTAAAPTP